MKARMLGWSYGISMVRKHSLTGIGYSRKIVQESYSKYVMEHGDKRSIENLQSGHQLVHMHNIWIETALESGIPAAAALFCFMLIRWWMLIGCLQGSHAGERLYWTAWVSLECSLFVAGLLFYMLKHNSGLLTWFVWTYLLLQASEWRFRNNARTKSKLVATTTV